VRAKLAVIGQALLGLAIGAVTAAVSVGCLALAGLLLAPALAFPARRDQVQRLLATGVLRLTGFEQRRLAHRLGDPEAAGYQGFGTERALTYLGVRWPVGLLGGAVLLLFVLGAGTVAEFGWEWAHGRTPDGIEPRPLVLGYFLVLGLVLAFLGGQGLIGVIRLERRIARRFLGPDPQDVLRRRIEELSASRAEIVEAVDAERRRIERDLHDGVQQRLVALGLLLGRARRSSAAGDQGKADDLLAQAHQESQLVLEDLREVAWRVYPTALDNLGLPDALARVAQQSTVPVTVHYDVDRRPPPSVEAAAYFVVSEAVTNTLKHAQAASITVDVRQTGGQGDSAMTVQVTDDGVGGADPHGSGLSGLAGRIGALDGQFDVSSPTGGPTVVTAVLPCG
jgi:signal transduction histidine kinase